MRSPALSAAQGGGEGTGKSLVLQGGVEIREAEEHFVDEEENLEEGETLIRAIKAFDDRGVLLCAGALVRSTLRENYPDREAQWDAAALHLSAGDRGSAGGGEGDAAKEEIFHDLWLSDSIESGVGPNLQIKGALAVLDCLFLHHLRHCEYFGMRFRGMAHFRVHAEGEFASSCRVAAQQRGFAFEVQEDTGEDILVFDSWHAGPEAYTRAALADGSHWPRAPSFARAILQQLSRTPPPLPLPAGHAASTREARGRAARVPAAPGRRWVEAWDGEEVVAGGVGWDGGFVGWAGGGGLARADVKTYGAWEGAVVCGVLGRAVEEGWEFSGARAADGSRWDGAGGWTMPGAQQVRRKRVRQYRLGRGILGAQTIQEIVAVCDAGVQFDGAADSVDGGPAWYASLMSQGQVASGVAETRIMELMQPAIDETIMPLVRDGFGRTDLHVCEAFVRVYTRDGESSPAPTANTVVGRTAGGAADGGGGVATGRMSIASHYDSLAFATVVVSLNPNEYNGGIYLQAGAHAASRRMVEMQAGDVLVHGHDMMHGVEVTSGRRYSLVLWLTAGEDACATRAAPWLRSAALAGDDVGQYALAALLDKESEGAAAEAQDSEAEAAAWYFASAAQGNPLALTRVASLLSEDEDSAIHGKISAWARAESGAVQTEAIPGFSSHEHAARFVEWLDGGSPSKCWEEAALQGYSAAQVALGEAYRDGACGVEEDAWKARCLLTLAAQQGDAEGAYALAELLLSDPGRFSCSSSSSDGGRGALCDGACVVVAGVVLKNGMPDTWCCGEYYATSRYVHGRAVYRKTGDARFALWYDDVGMWRLGDVSDVGSSVGRASVQSECYSPVGPHSNSWTVFVWSGREVGGEWQEQPSVSCKAVSLTAGDAGQTGAAVWEPSAWAVEEEHLHAEALACLRLAAGKAYEPALRRLAKMGLSA